MGAGTLTLSVVTDFLLEEFILDSFSILANQAAPPLVKMINTFNVTKTEVAHENETML